jgi:flavin-binding protein dodecin
MSATWAYDEAPRSGHPLLPGASPAAIRAALLPEDRERFDAAYEEALAQARESLDLTELFKRLEHWRRVALLQSNPTDYRRVVRRTAEVLTGQPVPDDEPLEVTRARAGL